MKEIGAPEEVIREFEREQLKQEAGIRNSSQPEILDVDSLMALDELSEQGDAAGNPMFIDER